MSANNGKISNGKHKNGIIKNGIIENGIIDESGIDDMGIDDIEPIQPKKETSFAWIAEKGYLFWRPIGRTARKTNVKIIFSDKECTKPDKIVWRNRIEMAWNDVLFISYGCNTPKFKEYMRINPDKRKHSKSCFSIISFDTTLDLMADMNVAKFWVKGLRNLLNQNEEFSRKISKKYEKSSYFYGFKPKQLGNQRNDKIMDSSHILKISDDFTVTLYYVYHEMMKENEWNIDYAVKMKMNSKYLYKLAQEENIKWYEWRSWMRYKLEEHLKLNNKCTLTPKLIVFGYIRSFQRDFDYELPHRIYQLCAKLYNDGIDQVEQYIDSKLNNILIHYFEPNHSFRYSFDELLCYGYLRDIQSKSNKSVICHYKNIYELVWEYYYLHNDDYFGGTNEECMIYKHGKYVTKNVISEDEEELNFYNNSIGAKWVDLWYGDGYDYDITIQWMFKVVPRDKKGDKDMGGIRIGVVSGFNEDAYDIYNSDLAAEQAEYKDGMLLIYVLMIIYMPSKQKCAIICNIYYIYR